MMDKYLNREESYQRLLSEYKKYSSLIVCVDFDDTIYDFHKKGDSYEQVIQLVRDLNSIGCYIIIWTGNSDLELIEAYLFNKNIPYDTINEGNFTAEKRMGKSRKIYANVYIDDRAGLAQVYEDLTRLLKEVKDGRKINN